MTGRIIELIRPRHAIFPRVLDTALERASLPLNEAAKKAEMDVSLIEGYVEGERLPDWLHLGKLARVLIESNDLLVGGYLADESWTNPRFRGVILSTAIELASHLVPYGEILKINSFGELVQQLERALEIKFRNEMSDTVEISPQALSEYMSWQRFPSLAHYTKSRLARLLSRRFKVSQGKGIASLIASQASWEYGMQPVILKKSAKHILEETRAEKRARGTRTYLGYFLVQLRHSIAHKLNRPFTADELDEVLKLTLGTIGAYETHPVTPNAVTLYKIKAGFHAIPILREHLERFWFSVCATELQREYGNWPKPFKIALNQIITTPESIGIIRDPLPEFLIKTRADRNLTQPGLASKICGKLFRGELTGSQIRQYEKRQTHPNAVHFQLMLSGLREAPFNWPAEHTAAALLGSWGRAYAEFCNDIGNALRIASTLVPKNQPAGSLL